MMRGTAVLPGCDYRAEQEGRMRQLCRAMDVLIMLVVVTVSCRGVKLIVTGGHISLSVAFKGPNVILEQYKYN